MCVCAINPYRRIFFPLSFKEGGRKGDRGRTREGKREGGREGETSM